MMDYHPSSYANGTTHLLLESSLKDILSSIIPVEEDRVKRLNTINDVTTLVHSLESLKGATVNPFGSFVSNLYTKWGDLDISIELPPGPFAYVGRRKKQNLLRDIMKALRRTGWCHNFQFIPLARVPLLIFESSFRNISCDISIGNHVGLVKSKILLWITELDVRFRDMVLLIKEWAKAHNINDPKAGTLNSFSLCLMVIFHFQTCNPAILPPLKDIYGGNIVDDITGTRFITDRQIEDICTANIARFRFESSGKRNESSLSELLISFFEKFSRIENLSPYYVICTYTGQWERIQSKFQWMEKPYKLIIEDPFEQPDNAARAVSARELTAIAYAFAETHRKLSSPGVPSDIKALLSSLVRPHIHLQIVKSPQVHSSIRGGYEQRTRVETNHTVMVEQLPNQFQNVLRLDRHRPSSSSSSSSTLSQPREGAVDVRSQNIWRSRYT